VGFFCVSKNTKLIICFFVLDRGRCIDPDLTTAFVDIDVACQLNCTKYEYEFDGNWTIETFPTQFDIVCSDRSILNDINTVQFVALLFR